MSEKRLDAKNRWRNVVVAFRMSPEEAQELNVKVALSGLSKQDYIIQCLLKHEVRVVAGKKVARKMEMYLEAMLEELQFLQDENMSDIDFDEMLMPLKHILTILKEMDCNGVQREHNKKLNNGLPILHKVPPKRDYGRYFCIMAEKGGTSHGGLTEKLSLFFHAKKQEVNAYGR